MQWPKSPIQISPICKRSMGLTPFPVVFCNDETCVCSTESSPLRLSVLHVSALRPTTNLHCNYRNQKLKGFSSSSQGVWERQASDLEACNNLGVDNISRRYGGENVRDRPVDWDLEGAGKAGGTKEKSN
ncbi:hypothetical protein MRB53_014689 [Persea americana]|uniref:Uncharacterized protein n=1 Tax=Persea americana TaxID=3435 RepID=A0ACC2KBI7_PERAE|nr:hypothetical protein MRB53_014689 [Persea americana]